MTWPPANLPVPQNWTDDTAAATVHASAHNVLGAAVDDIVDHLDPTTLSRFHVFVASSSGHASAGGAVALDVSGTPDELVGTDISVNVDNVNIDLNVDGIYVVYFYVDVTTATGFASVDLNHSADPFGGLDIPGGVISATEWVAAGFFGPYFRAAGSRVSASVACTTTDADVWDINYGIVAVQRVA